jgi:transketolase C-terminal domain/subunit
LINAQAQPPAPVRVVIEVGRPGVDHEAVEFVAAFGALASVVASNPTDMISVARVVTEIATLLPNPGA